MKQFKRLLSKNLILDLENFYTGQPEGKTTFCYAYDHIYHVYIDHIKSTYACMRKFPGKRYSYAF